MKRALGRNPRKQGFMQMSGDAIDWKHQPKTYRHFDPYGKLKWISEYVQNPDNIAAHAFWPLLRYTEVTRRYRHNTSAKEQRPDKERPIAYAGHVDTAIFSYYAAILTPLYERELARRDLINVVLAYRKSGKCKADPVCRSEEVCEKEQVCPRGPGASYQSAIDVFNWIRNHTPCDVYAFDVKGFFDTLDHQQVKEKWCLLLQVTKLPADHYKVYRATTRYSYVETTDIPASLRKKSRNRLCTPQDFDTHLRKAGLIKIHRDSKGIPQGLSISAILANIYMLDFDERVNEKITRLGGIYRRYADDLIIVLPAEVSSDFDAIEYVQQSILKEKLEIHPGKVQGPLRFENDGQIAQPLDYLGLVFDGNDITIRQASIDRFYRKMRKGIRAKAIVVSHTKQRKLYTKKLRRLYTHEGKRNFYSYVDEVAKAAGTDAPRRQLRNHAKIFERHLRIEKAKYRVK